MLLRTIENIRRKPKAVRQRYAFVTAATFTLLVAGVWSLSLPARFNAVQQGVIITASPERVSSQAASVPFSGVWSQFKQQLSNLGSQATSTASEVTEPGLMLDVPAATTTSSEDTSVLLESGSTIRFGTSQPSNDSPTILLGTTSTTSSTSPDGR